MIATRVLGWCAAAAGAVLVVLTYQLGYDVEHGSRAGAEPEIAGVFAALPFIAATSAQGVVMVVSIAVSRPKVVIGLATLAGALLIGQGALLLWFYSL